MKKHNLLKVVSIVLLLVVIGSWFLPVSIVNSTSDGFTTEESIKIGLFNIASYVGIVIQYLGPTLLYILAIGGFYGVLYRIPQYRLLLDKIVAGFKGKEWLFMSIVGVLFAVLTSMAGMSKIILFLFPLVISVILLMGYDKITAAMLTVGSVIAGLIGSVFSPGDVLGMSEVLAYGGIETAYDIAKMDVLWKIALLVVSLGLVLANTIIYAKKHKKEDVDLEKSRLIPKKVKTEGKVYPLVIVIDALLIVLTLGFISWDLLGVDVFSNITDAFINPTGSTFTKGLYNALNTVLGITVNSSTNNVFGNWSIAGMEPTLVLFLASALLAFIYRKSFNEFVSASGEGVKRALRPALFAGLAFVILVCSYSVPFEFSFLKYIIDMNSGFNLFVMCIVAIVFSALTVESYYGPVSAYSLLIAPKILEGNSGIIALVWQTMYGLTMLVAPTSVVLLVTLSYLDITYSSWFKAIWKLALELLAVILVILLLFNR